MVPSGAMVLAGCQNPSRAPWSLFGTLPYIHENTAGLTFQILQEQIPRLTTRERDFLHEVGLWDMMTMLAIQFHSTMLMASMERWDANTSMFLLPVGEMTVTLDDVDHILHLPIRGETMRYRRDWTEEDYRRE
ncbi:hypothetical protein SUGI_0988330 [Cryptomeria japonica]|nr:hypothetical protein SUGI_0988330 [Cryptomeria japonica]